MVQERRTAKRFDYDQAALMLLEDGKFKTILRSISQKGIFIEFEKELQVEEVVQIGWKDDRVGYVKGAFTVTIKKRSIEEDLWFYHARYLHIDQESKQNIIKLLNLLNQPQNISEDSDLLELQKVFHLEEKIFSMFKNEDSNLPKMASVFMKQIPDEVMEVHLDASTQLQKSFLRLQVYHIQLSLLVQFLETVKEIETDDLEYCIDYALYLMNEISSLEQTSGFSEPAHKENEEEDEQEEELRQQLNKSIIILSNKIYESLTALKEYCQEKKWEPKVVKKEDTDLGVVTAKSQRVVSLFESKYEISYDENSYGEAVLSRIYERSVEKKLDRDLVPEDIDFRKTKTSNWKTYILVAWMMLLAFQVLNVASGPKNQKSDFKKDLSYPIEIKKVEVKGQNILVYFDQAAWLTLGSNDVEDIRSESKAYLESQQRYKTIFVFSNPTQAQFMITNKESVKR